MKIVSVVNFSILQSLVAQKDYFAGNLFFQDTFFCSEADFTAFVDSRLESPVTGESPPHRLSPPQSLEDRSRRLTWLNLLY